MAAALEMLQAQHTDAAEAAAQAAAAAAQAVSQLEAQRAGLAEQAAGLTEAGQEHARYQQELEGAALLHEALSQALLCLWSEGKASSHLARYSY